MTVLNKFRLSRGLNPLSDTSADELVRSGLCHVEVESIGRGSPSDMAMLYPLCLEERAQWLAAYESDTSGSLSLDPSQPTLSAMLQVRLNLPKPPLYSPCAHTNTTSDRADCAGRSDWVRLDRQHLAYARQWSRHRDNSPRGISETAPSGRGCW